METGVATARLDDGSPERFVALRRALGVTSFGLNQMLLRPGQRGRIHRHEHQEEVYVVLSGVLTMEFEDGERDLSAGELIRVAPEVRRRVMNRGPAVCSVLAIGGAAEHQGRDGLSYAEWADTEPRPPQEVPLPEDLPQSELRGA